MNAPMVPDPPPNADTEADSGADTCGRLVAPCPPEWQAWEAGTGLCPYCDGMPFEEWTAMCDCFMSVEQWENITGLKASVRPPGPEFVPPIGDEPGVWIHWPADYEWPE